MTLTGTQADHARRCGADDEGVASAVAWMDNRPE
jgi:hypothetical protein